MPDLKKKKPEKELTEKEKKALKIKEKNAKIDPKTGKPKKSGAESGTDNQYESPGSPSAHSKKKDEARDRSPSFIQNSDQEGPVKVKNKEP